MVFFGQEIFCVSYPVYINLAPSENSILKRKIWSKIQNEFVCVKNKEATPFLCQRNGNKHALNVP